MLLKCLVQNLAISTMLSYLSQFFSFKTSSVRDANITPVGLNKWDARSEYDPLSLRRHFKMYTPYIDFYIYYINLLSI